MHQHITMTHSNKASKRKAEKNILEEGISNKRLAIDNATSEELLVTESDILSSSTIAFCNGIVSNKSVLNEDTFLGESFSEEIGRSEMHSTILSRDDLDESLSPDQDHNEFRTKEKDDSNDIFVLKAKILSCSTELERKETVINELENELARVKDEMAEQLSILNEEKCNLNENLNIALGKVSSLELDAERFKNSLKLCNATIRKMKSRSTVINAVSDINSNSKDMKKKLSESEERCKVLAQKLSELEASSKEAVTIDQKYRKLNDDLTKKTSELRACKTDLKNSEKRVKEYKDRLDESSKKVKELENSNNRLRVISDQGKEQAQRC